MTSKSNNAIVLESAQVATPTVAIVGKFVSVNDIHECHLQVAKAFGLLEG